MKTIVGHEDVDVFVVVGRRHGIDVLVRAVFGVVPVVSHDVVGFQFFPD